ncbi:hypothetical protein [Fodinicola acaciae]|uniref:hypothetical protein n=1 Tax=Fodinicola acaciae TaxID=2681555 RepID=UPI0013D80FF2|nr:hypothetical protein [Fodinicola acaciae]
MALTVVEDHRELLEPVVAELAAVSDWSSCWRPLDQPFGAEYANRVAAETGWRPVPPVQVLSGQPLRSMRFTLASGRHVVAAPAAVRPALSWVWAAELDKDAGLAKEAAAEALVNDGRMAARQALDDIAGRLATQLGRPGEPTWVTPDDDPRMSHPGFVVSWPRHRAVVQLDVWEDGGYLAEPWTWEVHLWVRPEAAR